jgi:hypothetical protein
MDTITLLITALATARLTRLITRDEITHGARRRILATLDPHGLLAYLVVCDWCVSVYIGAAAAGAGALAGAWPWLWVLPLTLAFSQTAGWMASREGE